MAEITPGLIGEATQVVTRELTAAVYGSGLVAGYATPAMIATPAMRPSAGRRSSRPLGVRWIRLASLHDIRTGAKSALAVSP